MNQPKRCPPPKGRLPFLDGIRGIAILAVFLYHALGVSYGTDRIKWNGLFRDFSAVGSFPVFYPLTYGWAGVAIFFVVSGFCIHWSYEQSSDKGWLNFCNRRLFRIYPPYLLALGVFFFSWPWGSLSIHPFGRLAHFATHVLAVHNLDPRTCYRINPAFWSIAVEIQLYAIYPLLLLIIAKKGWRNGLLAVAALELLIRLAESIGSTFFHKPLPYFVRFSPFAYWFDWAIGAYLARCVLERRRTVFSKLRFDVVAVIAFVLPLFKPTEPLAFLAFALLAGVAIDRLISQSQVIFANKVLQIGWSHLSFLGVISYSFYLFHLPFVDLTPRVLGAAFPASYFLPLIKFILCLAWYPLVLALSFCVYRIVEQPSIAVGKVLWNRFHSVQGVSAKKVLSRPCPAARQG